jgi:hypothetical protein
VKCLRVGVIGIDAKGCVDDMVLDVALDAQGLGLGDLSVLVLYIVKKFNMGHAGFPAYSG